MNKTMNKTTNEIHAFEQPSDEVCRDIWLELSRRIRNGIPDLGDPLDPDARRLYIALTKRLSFRANLLGWEVTDDSGK